jgi:O-acetyl-ADP-ribose deacetylase
MAGIRVIRGDITRSDAQAIVNPANSRGLMGGGVALAIRQAAGRCVEDEAKALAPIAVGKAAVTGAGAMPQRYVIHAPTMTEPAERIGVGNVRSATIAALAAARELGVSSVAFPGMGTGVGGVPFSDAARAMVECILEFAPEFSVLLIDIDLELTREFEKWLALLVPETR